MIKPIACLLSLILPALVLAQDATDESAEEEIRRYAVEVIIFRYAQDLHPHNRYQYIFQLQ